MGREATSDTFLQSGIGKLSHPLLIDCPLRVSRADIKVFPSVVGNPSELLPALPEFILTDAHIDDVDELVAQVELPRDVPPCTRRETIDLHRVSRPSAHSADHAGCVWSKAAAGVAVAMSADNVLVDTIRRSFGGAARAIRPPGSSRPPYKDDPSFKLRVRCCGRGEPTVIRPGGRLGLFYARWSLITQDGHEQVTRFPHELIVI